MHGKGSLFICNGKVVGTVRFWECVAQLRGVTRASAEPAGDTWLLAGEVSSAKGFKLRLGDTRGLRTPTTPVAVGRFEDGHSKTVVHLLVRPTSPWPFLIWTAIVLIGIAAVLAVWLSLLVVHLLSGDHVPPGRYVVTLFLIAFAVVMYRWALPIGETAERALLVERIRTTLQAEEADAVS